MPNIAVLGYGTVGTGLLDLIDKNRERNKISNDIGISSILVKNRNKHENKKYYSLVTQNVDEVFSKPSDIVIEVMGGVSPAYEYVKKAILLGKHVITANKDLIAEHGKELLDLAKYNNVTLNFEASVGGGIPILKPLIECLSGNDILSITAILNGTTNFILTKMFSENMDYESALNLAQNLGFAEANPDADVLGYDSARKLSILSTIAYKQSLKWSDISIDGITSLEPIDFEYAKNNGFSIKLVAMSKYNNKNVFACVKPMLIPLDSNLSRTNNEFNSINIYGDAVGEVTFYGKGAGMFPTASSVYGDLIDILTNKKVSFEFSNKTASITPILNETSTYMLRINTTNETKILALLPNLFKNHNIRSVHATNNCVLSLIDSENESYIEEVLEKIQTIDCVKNTKKLLVLK